MELKIQQKVKHNRVTDHFKINFIVQNFLFSLFLQQMFYLYNGTRLDKAIALAVKTWVKILGGKCGNVYFNIYLSSLIVSNEKCRDR